MVSWRGGQKGVKTEVKVFRWTLVLAIVALLLSGGCAFQSKNGLEEDEIPPEERAGDDIVEPVEFWFPDALRWLTESEKSKVVEIALNTPEAREWLQKESEYRIQINWIVMYPDPSGEGYYSYRRFDYEIVETGIPIYPPNRIVLSGDQKAAEIHPNVHISFGEPLEWLIDVAVDLDKEEAVYVDSYPARHPIVPNPKE